MALYALGDLHLSFGTDKPMDMFGRAWHGHAEKIRQNCARIVRPEDTLVLVGDHSWGRDLEECMPDFDFIRALPGRKVLIRGNHDCFWNAKKTAALNERFAGELFFLQNNYYPYGEYALVGTKGYTWEGKDSREHAEMLVERELVRLGASFDAAEADGFSRFIMFLHFPPTNILERNSGFTRMAEKRGAEQVVYAHCHGEERFGDSLHGRHHGVRYHLVSGDFLHFMPKKILD